MEVERRHPFRIGILISGRGSNMEAIANSIDSGQLKASISIVISDIKDAIGLEKAKKRNIECFITDRKSFATKVEYERDILSTLEEHQVNLVVLAGYMQIVGATILKWYPNRVINIHPSLLPSFPGLHAQKQALEYGVKFSGCTVHFVDGGMDTGPIILQAVVPILDTDTEESLSERILQQEHIIYSKAIGLIAEDLVEIKGRQVLIKEPTFLR